MKPATATERSDSIGFLVKTYPKLSETFILEEILGLERSGLALHIYSLQMPTDTIAHPATATVCAPLSYVTVWHWRGWRRFAATQLWCLLQRPLRYLKTGWFLLQREESGRWRDLLQAGCLTRQLRRDGIRHLHVHFINRPTAVAELVRQLSGISYSISAHAKDIYLSPPTLLQRKLRGARFAVTCTEYNRRHLAEIAPPQIPVIRLYHGVDLQRLRPDPRARKTQPPLLLSVGRLREKKGFSTLIDACAQLHRAGIELRCRIIGYGPEQASLRAQIERLGLQDIVELPGKLPHEAVIGQYSQATLFALPCRIDSDGDRDGIPNVLLEALAMQLPVVSTRISGIPEVIEAGISGLLIEPEDPAALAAAIRTILNDAALAMRLGKAGRLKVAQRFSNDNNLKQLRQLLSTAQAHAVNGVAIDPAGEKIYG
jgi:glycosyltransferase involved in cell wall biosynthesis